jgi:hypothetical protein
MDVMRGAHLPFLVLVAATCGGDKVNHLADAPADQATDGPDSGLVTLTVTVAGAPNPNVRVYFQNADSSLVKMAMTDANGVATAVMEPGGFVTAIEPDLVVAPAFGIATQHVATFAGVKPNDSLVLATPVAPALDFSVVAPLDAGASTYFLWTNCGDQTLSGMGSGSGTSPTAVELTGCADTTVDMVVESRDGTGAPLHGLFQTVVVAAGQLTTLTNAYAPLSPTAMTFANVPAGATSVEVSQTLAATRGRLDAESLSAPVTGTTASGTLQQLTIGGATAITTSSPAGVTGAFSTHIVLDWAPYATSFDLDFGNLLLGSYTGLPTFDVTSHAVSWVEAPGASADFSLTSVSAFRSAAPSQSWEWRIASPTHAGSGAGSYVTTYPTLPAPDDTYNFQTADNPSVFDMVTAKVPGGYDSVRAKLLASPNGLFDLVTGATGQVVLQETLN